MQLEEIRPVNGLSVWRWRQESHMELEQPRPQFTIELESHVQSTRRGCINHKGVIAQGRLFLQSLYGDTQIELTLLLYHSIKLLILKKSKAWDPAVGNLGLSLKEKETHPRMNVCVNKESKGILHWLTGAALSKGTSVLSVKVLGHVWATPWLVWECSEILP